MATSIFPVMVLISVVAFSISAENPPQFLRVCYYVFGDPDPSKINGTLCTHIINGFFGVSNGTLSLGSSEELKRCSETVQLKKKYPELKVMLSIGGGGNDKGFSAAVNSYQNRKKFIASIVNFLVKYNYDGLDIDWEFPVWNDNVPADRKNFIYFLKEFKSTSGYNSGHSFLLSAAVAGPKTVIDDSYDIPAMANYIDFINLMSYDYHDYTFYTPFTGHNSPLFNRSAEHAYFATLNTAWSAIYWNEQGMPLKKIMVGLPTYGHTYHLLDPKWHGFDAPATGFGTGDGTIIYPETCTFLKKGGTRVFDVESQVPYAYREYDWIAYDDNMSISSKAKWVKANGFGGVMTYDLNCDDWEAVCDGETKFPLHQLIYDILAR